MPDKPKKSNKSKKCIKCDKSVYCSDLCSEHFKDYFEKKIKRTIKKFDLFSKKDRVGVAVSGGKDSTTALYVLKKLGYNIEAVTVDAVIGNYTKKNLENLRKVCKKYDVKLNEINFREEFGSSLCFIKSVAQEKGLTYSSCMICGVLRRYLLNKYAKKWKFDCLVTGHNLDDEAQAFIMNVFRNDLILAKRQGPVSGSGKANSTKVFVKRVKPLYLCTEEEIIKYSKFMKFPVNYEPCPCREGAYRKEYADMLDAFEKKFPPTKYNIVQFFLRTVHQMKEKDIDKEADKDIEIGKCEKCGEPCAKKICKRCEILGALKGEIKTKK
ncbi:MAG: TIGR00269 family protein [Nanoarchaeota archaeon]|nr:TIGR00269 family protein [Nanoarchaeota archaeon]MBU1321231.1 TIGR00269 family protein [Nanoarchaeota archaeon]MBU1597036.1 TIGR00269 family protein [Nanoarchaeota archaeon]MBU2441818.1 TIGR00269 family protein [Nanoarchaeota archaeon]